jgi:hypothetical protein
MRWIRAKSWVANESPTAGQDMNEMKFQSELLGDERLIWTGQPDPTVVFDSSDAFLVPFSLLWGGFALFWEANVLGLGPFGDGRPGPLFMALWGIPFVLIGLYFIVGRFFYKAWKKQRTYYALTNKRALVLTEGRARTVRACFLASVPSINKSVRRSGVGAITFGNPTWADTYANSGMEVFGRGGYGEPTLRFSDIRDADRVYGLVTTARKELPGG